MVDAYARRMMRAVIGQVGYSCAISLKHAVSEDKGSERRI